MISHSKHLRGFTLTEILIVIGIIVLLLAIAVPAMRVLSGGRSIDGAENQISAFLGRARAEAMARQELTGVFFFKDVEGRTNLALVREVDNPFDATKPVPPTPPEVFLDLVSEDGMRAEAVVLPAGVDAQFLDATPYDNPPLIVPPNERYVGFNDKVTAETATASSTTATGAAFGGVILFDVNGQIANRTYGFRAGLIYDVLYPYGGAPTSEALYTWADDGGRQSSQGAFILFDRETFEGAGGSAIDPMLDRPMSTTFTPQEATEEVWLNDNSVPLMINRYNGTLVRGE